MQMKNLLFSRALLSAALLAAPILTSCGGSISSAPPPVFVSISPSSVNLPAGGSQTFAATVTGSNNTTVIWSVREGAAGGLITDAGAYTAPMSPGTFHVVATSMTDNTKSASSIVSVPPVAITISPSAVTMTSGETQTFTAAVTGSLNQVVTWSVEEGSAGGTINSSGAYLAPGISGTYHVVATSQADLTRSGTATVTVVPFFVAIMPASVGMKAGGTQSFSATVLGSSNVAVIWAVQEGTAGGTITGAGFYTAPTALGTYHVIATSAADPRNSATATVAVLQSGFFTPTGSMGSARGGQTATLLPNGIVLVAGGGRGGIDLLEPFPIGELFDAATGSFTATGSTQREFHSATLLLNGKVLFVGGIDNVTFPNAYPGVAATAELYDPATGSFTPTGSMATPRFSHTATLLANGQVLVTGGLNVSAPAPNWGVVATAELYDPATGSFTSTGSMATARGLHTATLLQNGKVLVAGGFTGSLGTLATAELYDPATGSFTSAGSMATGRGEHTATLLLNGKVLVAGGATVSFGPLATAELYDPATDSFTSAGSMAAGRSEHTATLLLSGKVLVAGGLAADGSGITTAELYDPALGFFTPTGSMATGRGEHTATLLPNGNVLVSGGVANGVGVADPGTEIATAELYQ